MLLVIVDTIATLSGLGITAAVVLYFVAQKFKVYEDPRIDEVEEALPAANCGGCGFAGCRNFAESCVKSESFEGLYCPVGGNEVMTNVARILGREAITQDPQVAVLLCNGTCENRPKTSHYDGASTCAITSSVYGGDTGCQFGCLGHGDCVEVCDFDALHMDPVTGLPVVDDSKCTACGACVKACPKNLFELRKRAKNDRKIYVACKNQDKGGIAKKSCSVACIGCSKCFKVCPFEAITMADNLAYIDADKCRLCRKCVTECPTNAIIEIGFPPRKIKTEETAQANPDKTENKSDNNY
ncbi:MAG: Fe-S cluster domain-containing protein [Bacteroidales bacterium]|nr:Fe-S cluster domain-containing protein [Bacteroidales bacterium]MBN2821506.1 Fe-S cluster domain-containing protein [Bacteroidales bacterium]